MQNLLKRQVLNQSANLTLLVLAALFLLLFLRAPLAAALARQSPAQPEDLLASQPPCASLSERGIGFDFFGYLPQADDTTVLAWRITNPTRPALDAVGFNSNGWTPLTPGDRTVYRGAMGDYAVRWALHNLIPSHEAFFFQPQGDWFQASAQETFVLTVRNFDPQRHLFAWVHANPRLTQVHLKPGDHHCLIAPPAPSPTPMATPSSTLAPFSPLPTPTATPAGYTWPAEPVVAACVFTPPPDGIRDEPTLPLNAYSFSAPQVVLTNTAPIGIQQWLPDSETLLVTRESSSNQLVSVDLVNTSNGDITEIVEARKYLREPMWLSANRTVAWQEYGPFQDESFNINQPGYWTRSFDPPGERRLSEDGRSGWSVSHDVAPDGKQFVFMALPGGTQPLIWNQETKALRALPVDLTNWRYGKSIYYRLQAFSPLWQPDGDRILFWDGIWVFLYDLTTDRGCEINLRTLSSRYPAIHEASWSPHGRYFLMKIAEYPLYTTAQGPHGLLVLDTYTGEAVPYPQDNLVYGFPWAPDSQTVAMIGVTGQKINLPNIGLLDNHGIYLLNVRDGEQQQVLPAYYAGGLPGLVWSPNGARLAFKGASLEKFGTAEHSGGLLISQVTLNR